jgi:hypothetical protein
MIRRHPQYQKKDKLVRWGWLHTHPQRAEIVRWVLDPSLPLDAMVPQWEGLGETIDKDLIVKHRIIVQGRISPEPVSIRKLGVRTGLLRTQIWDVIQEYLEYGGQPREEAPADRQSYRDRAREVVTPELVREYRAGRVSMRGIAEKIGLACTLAAARYWVRKIGEGILDPSPSSQEQPSSPI